MSDTFDILNIEYERHLQICDMLEIIADALPDRAEPQLCRHVAKLLCVNMPRHHRMEEDVLFPLLRRRARPEDNFNQIANEMIREHVTDQAYADELADSLEQMAAGQSPENPDMTGYMLRAFFESYRRHLLLESVVVLPLARARLTSADRTLLAEGLRISAISAPKAIAADKCSHDDSNVVFLSQHQQ